MKRGAVQLELDMPTHGGARKGAGAKRQGLRPCVPHVERDSFRAEHPVHVTVRLRDGVPSLREQRAWLVIVAVLKAVRGRLDFRVVHVSVQTNHVHFIIEAGDVDALESGMRSLSTRLAKQLNRCFGRRGRFFADRYHANAIATPREARATLAYVLLNARKHAAEAGRAYASDWLDPFSSAATFDGWSSAMSVAPAFDCGTSPATTWLLCKGWRLHGPIAIDHVPGSPRTRSRAPRRDAPWPQLPADFGTSRARDMALARAA